MAIWYEAERTGTTARVEYQDALTLPTINWGSWFEKPVPAVIMPSL